MAISFVITHLAAATPIDPVSPPTRVEVAPLAESDIRSNGSTRCVNSTRDSGRRRIRRSRGTFRIRCIYAVVEERERTAIAVRVPSSCHRRVSRRGNSEDDTPLSLSPLSLSFSSARTEFVRRHGRRRRRSIFGRARRMPPAIWLRPCARDINRSVNGIAPMLTRVYVVSHDSVFSR